MEDTLGDSSLSATIDVGTVLILVLMEDTLGDLAFLFSSEIMKMS